MLYYEDIKLRRRRRGIYRRETSYIYVLGAKPLDEPLTNTGDTLQRCHIVRHEISRLLRVNTSLYVTRVSLRNIKIKAIMAPITDLTNPLLLT
jgi:hypothetical protein